MFLAQEPLSPDAVKYVVESISGLGIPTAWLLVIGYTVRRLFKWAMPNIENIIQAYISRQNSMEECLKKLTEGTLAIQSKNGEMLKVLIDRPPLSCPAIKFSVVKTHGKQELVEGE
jgi:hypothetical protein